LLYFVINCGAFSKIFLKNFIIQFIWLFMYGSFVSHITSGGEPQSSIIFPFVLCIFDWLAGSPRWLPMICIPPSLLYHFLPRIMRGARSGVVFTPAPTSILGCAAWKIQVPETGLFEKLPYWDMEKNITMCSQNIRHFIQIYNDWYTTYLRSIIFLSHWEHQMTNDVNSYYWHLCMYWIFLQTIL
jgi:hypothetical protein